MPVRDARLRVTLAISTLIASVTALIIFQSTGSKSLFPLWVVSAVIGVSLGVVTIIVTLLVIDYRRTVVRFPYRMAVTGLPEVGKTVFSVLLFDSLMNERLPTLSFTGEAKTVISVYQAIRNLPSGRWPLKTVPGNVSMYTGEIQDGKDGRKIIDLAVGDTAGEYWLNFNRAGSAADEDPYLEFVITSDAIMHLLPIDRITNPDSFAEFVRNELTDLELAARLRVGLGPPLPLLIVVSKADLLFGDDELRANRDELLVPQYWLDFNNLALTQELFNFSSEVAPGLREELERFNDRLARSFCRVYFAFSTVKVVTDSNIAVRHAGELMQWISREADSKLSDRRF